MHEYIKRHEQKHDLQTCERKCLHDMLSEHHESEDVKRKKKKLNYRCMVGRINITAKCEEACQHASHHLYSVCECNECSCMPVYEFFCMWSLSSQPG